MAESTKVGIISCSGEEIPAGTIARLATRRCWSCCGLNPPSHSACPCSWRARRRSGARRGSTRPSPSTAATSSAPDGAPRNTVGRWKHR